MHFLYLTIPSSRIGAVASSYSASTARSGLVMLAMVMWLAASSVFASTVRVNFAKYQSVTASGQTSTYSADFATEMV
jgi:hypothetical protein